MFDASHVGYARKANHVLSDIRLLKYCVIRFEHYPSSPPTFMIQRDRCAEPSSQPLITILTFYIWDKNNQDVVRDSTPKFFLPLVFLVGHGKYPPESKLLTYPPSSSVWGEKAKFALRAKITARISHLAVEGKGGRVKSVVTLRWTHKQT